MKVFATLLINGGVLLKTWPSLAKFNKSESCFDDKFIFIATSKDFKGDWLTAALFDCDLEIESHVRPVKGEFRIMYNANHRKAHSIMCQARRDYMGIK